MAGGGTDWSNVPIRVGSALVIATIAFVALWFGGWVWATLVALGAVRMLYEWLRMVKGRAVWVFIGFVYILIPTVAAIWLRGETVGLASTGFRVLLFTILIVIAADAGAYFAGKQIGGPKMAPRLSPNKTWAGFFGGLALGMLVGGGLAAAFGSVFILGMGIAAAIVIAAVFGDFLESGFKRHFGVKDMGSILPGHGGLLDRVDSHMTAIVLAALMTLAAPALLPL